MDSTAAIKTGPTYYSQTFRHEVDRKRRVSIPAKWRPEEPIEFTLMVWLKSPEGPCLRVLPPDQMATLMRDLVTMPNDDPSKTILKRLIGSQSAQVTVDKVGRICIPDEFAREAGITDKAVLVGCLDKFEIWNPERYERVKAADNVMAAEAFKRME